MQTDGRRHAVKYMEASVFGRELAAFWGDYEYPEDESQEGWDTFFAWKRSDATASGKRANDEKMAGFYVDLDADGETVLSPATSTRRPSPRTCRLRRRSWRCC